MKRLDKHIFNNYINRLSHEELVDVCHELQCEVIESDNDDALVMKYNCAIAAKWFKISKYRARTIQKGTDGEMFTFSNFVEYCKQGKFKNGVGFYADNVFTYTDIPIKPIHVLSDCHRTDFRYIIWFEFRCYDDYEEDIEEERLDYTQDFDDFSLSKQKDVIRHLLDKRSELVSKFHKDETKSTTDIEDFDKFVKRYWNLEWKFDKLTYE